MKLRKAAIAKGMTVEKARVASVTTLNTFVNSNKSSGAPVKKSTGTKPATRKPVAKKSATAKVPAKSVKTGAKAKRPATKPATRRATKNSEPVGRKLIDNKTLDYNDTTNWNPRKGSAVAVIFAALKKSRGNVEKSFEILVPRISELVGSKKRDGEKRTKADKENMLKYRINRTKFDFAIKTGQHEVATDRIEYGTGPYATKAPAKKRVAAKPAGKPNTTAKRRGRPPGVKNKPKVAVKRGR
jgi:hypothetical protein